MKIIALISIAVACVGIHAQQQEIPKVTAAWVIITPDNRALNPLPKQCGSDGSPVNGEGACYDPNYPHIDNNLYLTRKDCEAYGSGDCVAYVMYRPANQPLPWGNPLVMISTPTWPPVQPKPIAHSRRRARHRKPTSKYAAAQLGGTQE